MIGAVILGALLGFVLVGAGIVWRMFTGQPTVVTATGWAVGPMRTGGWGMLIGAVIGLAEVLSGTKLRETWGLRISLSSLGGLIGGLLGWWLYTAISAPATAAPPAAPAGGK